MNTNAVSTNINPYSTNLYSYRSPETFENATSKESAASTTVKSPAAVYEPSAKELPPSIKRIYQRESASLKSKLDDLKQSQQKLESIVAKTFQKQMQAHGKDGFLAKKDIAEDGYWGAMQTSERIFSFSVTLANGDPSKSDDMMNAVEKGFQQAKETWNNEENELPSMINNTLDATQRMMEDWKNAS